MVRKAIFAALIGAVAAYAAPSNAGVVTTTIFTGDSGTGGGAPFSGPVGTIVTPDISFATSTGFNWHPFGLGSFGADSVGTLSVAVSGTYTFTLNSDDGSRALIGGALIVDDGGAHGPTVATGSVFLTAGLHPFEVQFFECCGGASGVDFSVPQGVTIAGIPELATWGMMIIGFGGVALQMHRRRRAVTLNA